MDDIIDSVNDKENAVKITKHIEDTLDKGGFKMKDWIYSKDPVTTDEEIMPTLTEKVLDLTWSPSHDEFHFKVKSHAQEEKQKERNTKTFSS